MRPSQPAPSWEGRAASPRIAVLAWFLAHIWGVGIVAMAADDGAAGDPVPLFDAIAAGDVEARVKAHGFSQATLTLRNISKKTIRVEIPNAFAAISIVRARRQASGGGRGAYGYGGGGSSGDSQTLGISAYRPSSSHKSNSMDASKAAEYRRAELMSARVSGKVVELKPRRIVRKKFPSFCLELGLPDPSPRMPYVPIPLQRWTSDKRVHELIVRFGQGEHSQQATQLAIWHIANKASWTKLQQVRWPTRGRTTAKQIAAARRAVESVQRVVNAE